MTKVTSSNPKAPRPVGSPPGVSTPERSRAGSVLTDRQGAPVVEDDNSVTVGSRGPMVLGNFQFLEKLAHFDRERIP